jgi:RNA polymerase sigma factor (sigma-70 family)
VTRPGKAGRDILREVLKLQGLIRAVLRRYGVPEADLPDCTQDVLVTAHRRISEGGFTPPDPTLPLAENVAAWIGGIARWTAVESARARARYAKVFVQHTAEHPVDRAAIAVPSPEARLEAKDELAIFDRAKLSPKQLEVVALAAEGYTARQIAELLGIPTDTVSTRLRRARWAWEKAKGKRRR